MDTIKYCPLKASKQYLRFYGIDMAKQKHVACIIDRDGKTLLKPKSIRNNAEGFQQILNCLKQTGRTKSILTGMEATGHPHEDASANVVHPILDDHCGRWHIEHYARRAICEIFGEENIVKINITQLLLLLSQINCAISFGES